MKEENGEAMRSRAASTRASTAAAKEGETEDVERMKSR